MTDYRFDDVVTNVTVERGPTPRPGTDRGPVECSALCSACGTYHTVTLDELWLLADATAFEYVASMRAWNCCHEGEIPYDGFPEAPDNDRIDGPDTTDAP
jgi:hypothetical protein